MADGARDGGAGADVRRATWGMVQDGSCAYRLALRPRALGGVVAGAGWVAQHLTGVVLHVVAGLLVGHARCSPWPGSGFGGEASVVPGVRAMRVGCSV
ncbi:hypothetical protein [Streptomyces turgidiscabies]|uniref:Uncharacterized protein n=1 Tax=Streptomyces turgidiscabies TaxID=85558 RepID=A0ABU0RG39_9ACTN|nr:hypothetical protein [Streptomyces turgidiscabies]MDQ0930957.1 hypothetical protein [Streptomyces turgidiscabies]